jgi:membrane associated rhomboid family serine protease
MSIVRSIRDDIRYELSNGNMITRLIIANAIVFFAINLLYMGSFFYYADRMKAGSFIHSALQWVGIPPHFKLILSRPWVLLTHMFVHLSFFHFLFNMIGLYWFGNIVREFTGNKRILPLYIMGGLAGAVLLMVFYYFFPALRPAGAAIGASAGVLAIIVAAATIVPDYTVFLFLFGPVKIKWIAAVLVLIDLISIPQYNTGGHIAHLGGALFGFVYIRQLKLGFDMAEPFEKIYKIARNWLQPRPTSQKSYKRTTVPPINRQRSSNQGNISASKQERIDAILDKISHSGYDSLSKEEKEFLFRISKED